MHIYNLHDDIGNDLWIHATNAVDRLDAYHYPKLKEGNIVATAIVCYFEGKESWQDMKNMISHVENTILESEYFSFHHDKIIHCFIAVEGMCGIIDDVENKIKWMHMHHVKVGSLCWNDHNALACGAKAGNYGLSKLGISCVKAMNEVHMHIDVSHACEKCVNDILHHSIQPVFATHSNPKGFYQHFRNLNDAQMTAIKKQHGIIGLLPLKAFLTDNKECDIDTFIAAIDYAKAIVGYKHLAFGFDFMDYYEESIDYVDANEPMVKNIHDASCVQLIVKAMKEHHYTQKEIQAICFDNAFAFFNNHSSK